MRSLFYGMLALLLQAGWLPARSQSIEIDLKGDALQYCHILRFPQGWQTLGSNERGAPLPESLQDYEFRVAGLLGSEFLVGGLLLEAEPDEYALNQYKADLSTSSAAVPIGMEEWQAAGRIPLHKTSVLPNSARYTDPAVHDGQQFAKLGDKWPHPGDGTRLSPDGIHLVLQSFTGPNWLTVQDENFRGRYAGQVFFDVFDAGNGGKLFTIEGDYRYDVDQVLRRTGWVTERYFIIPLGDRFTRAVVCEFGNRP